MHTTTRKSVPAPKRKRGSPEDAPQPGSNASEAKYILRLYISRSTEKSTRAVENLQRVCEQYLVGRYDLKVIDIHQQASLARAEQIVAVPTLIKRLPLPLQRLVGDMSDHNKVLFGLDLRTQEQ